VRTDLFERAVPGKKALVQFRIAVTKTCENQESVPLSGGHQCQQHPKPGQQDEPAPLFGRRAMDSGRWFVIRLRAGHLELSFLLPSLSDSPELLKSRQSYIAELQYPPDLFQTRIA